MRNIVYLSFHRPICYQIFQVSFNAFIHSDEGTYCLKSGSTQKIYDRTVRGEHVRVMIGSLVDLENGGRTCQTLFPKKILLDTFHGFKAILGETIGLLDLSLIIIEVSNIIWVTGMRSTGGRIHLVPHISMSPLYLAVITYELEILYQTAKYRKDED